MEQPATLGKVRWRRLVLGCLVAGVVFQVLVVPLNMWEAPVFEAWFEARGLTLPRDVFAELPSAEYALVMWTAFLTGMGLGGGGVGVYVAIRPRFGPGWRTALYAGLIVWFFAYPVMTTIVALTFSLPVQFTTQIIVTHLIPLCLATEVGAWLYRED